MKSDAAEAVEAALASAGPKLTMTGASFSGLGWLTSNEFFGLAGVLIGVIGLLITWHYKRQEHRLRVLEHELRTSLMRRRRHADTDYGQLEDGQ